MKTRLFWIALLLSLFAILAWFIPPFPLFMTIVLLGALLLPVLVFAFICLWLGWRRGRTVEWVMPVLHALLIAFAFSVVLVPVNRQIFRLARDDAMAFPDRLSPLLEEYRTKHGTYPRDLKELPNPPSLPRMMSAESYQSDGQSYSFRFNDQALFGMLNTFENSSMEWEGEF
ncbi:hypothetical protein WJU23_07815 [Prosthecobacter sp. SYSU 5D2]|uniref:hypothetical protein n=1 Tax=Prosthecobacter sp. SYSU 5D2 TaxID=3134134 RepID=UPI0031FF0089